MLFQKLQNQSPASFPKGQLRTLQRRVKEWRTAIARRLVLGIDSEIEPGGIGNGMSAREAAAQLSGS